MYEESDALLNLAIGMVMPADEASRLLDAYHEEAVQMTEFVEQRLNSNNVSLWNPIPNLKVKTFFQVWQRNNEWRHLKRW